MWTQIAVNGKKDYFYGRSAQKCKLTDSQMTHLGLYGQHHLRWGLSCLSLVKKTKHM